MFKYSTEDGYLKLGKIVAHVIIAIFLITALFNSFTVVGSGKSGVVTNFGAVSDVVLQEGLHFKTPFVTKIVIIDNRVVRADVEAAGASKDLQTINATVAVNYRVDKNNSSNIYKNVNKDYENIIVKPAVQEAIKSITAKYNAEELITKRQDVSDQMKALLIEKIQGYGLIVENFNIVNFGFSKEFDQAIESKQTAQQMALKAEQDLIRIKTEAEQQIATAKAEAEALRVKKEQTTPEMVQMEWIKKWNGQMPTYTSGGDGGGMNFYMPVK